MAQWLRKYDPDEYDCPDVSSKFLADVYVRFFKVFISFKKLLRYISSSRNIINKLTILSKVGQCKIMDLISTDRRKKPKKVPLGSIFLELNIKSLQ